MYICRFFHHLSAGWRSPVTMLTVQSPDGFQRYELPLLYWDCLTPPSCFIHPQENPNAQIPKGDLSFFFFTICLPMIYWLRLPPSQRITDPFWEIRFSHLSLMCTWRGSPETVKGGNWLWGAAVCESLWCHSAANGASSGRPLHLSLYSSALFSSW